MKRPGARSVVTLMSLFCLSIGTAVAQEGKRWNYNFSADGSVVSRYIWRGQRLTNGWSLQPGGTLSLNGFSVNVWGNMDLAAVNEGDALLINENPAAVPGGDNNGLQGHFSEIDYTFSYAFGLRKVDLEAGTIVYTFPDRSASLPSTTEIYGRVGFWDVPLAPSATVYLDVDESAANGGQNGAYILLAAEHSIPLSGAPVSSLDLSTSLSFVNNGFSEFYYGVSDSGPHDFLFTVSTPIHLSEHWSASAFVSYSALLGDFRNHQFLDPREVYRGTSGSPASLADTVWGGVTLSLGF